MYIFKKFFDRRITCVFKIQTKLDINIFKISSIENPSLYGKRAMSDLFRVKIFFVANVSFFVASNARSSLRSTDVVWKNSYSPAKTFCKTTNSQQNMWNHSRSKNERSKKYWQLSTAISIAFPVIFIHQLFYNHIIKRKGKKNGKIEKERKKIMFKSFVSSCFFKHEN